MTVCDGLPSWNGPADLSGDVADWRDLAYRIIADLEQTGIQLLLDHIAQAIDLPLSS